ncbi:MAG: hypothetical protein WBN41_16510, partial [Lysobacterales bacterium]
CQVRWFGRYDKLFVFCGDEVLQVSRGPCLREEAAIATLLILLMKKEFAMHRFIALLAKESAADRI